MQLGTLCHHSEAGCPITISPHTLGASWLNAGAGQQQEVAEAQWWVLGDPVCGDAWRDPNVLGHEHQPGP